MQDYWLSMLYKRLVGSNVYLTEVLSPAGERLKPPNTLRFYAHSALNGFAHAIFVEQAGNCFYSSATVVYGMNLMNRTNQITFSLGIDSFDGTITQYLMTAPGGDLISKCKHKREDILNAFAFQICAAQRTNVGCG